MSQEQPQPGSPAEQMLLRFQNVDAFGEESQTKQTEQNTSLSGMDKGASMGLNKNPITIGEALEATAITAGHKPVDRSDAAAIQAAEVRATGRTNIMPGGLAATAQSAAQHNARTEKDEDKTKLADVLTDAASKLPSDKAATRQDAEGVVGAELRNNPNLVTHPTGVAASIVAAARLNQSKPSDPANCR
ncbi:hypothetical protein Droror1_Dr00002008 [Drosera rotundifolia]